MFLMLYPPSYNRKIKVLSRTRPGIGDGQISQTLSMPLVTREMQPPGPIPECPGGWEGPWEVVGSGEIVPVGVWGEGDPGNPSIPNEF